MTAERSGLVGFSGRWPKVYHAVREDDENMEHRDRSRCGNFIWLHFFFDYTEMPQVNADWCTSLTPCTSCFGAQP